MSANAHQLETVQRWMQAVIMHPDGITKGINSPEARQHFDVASADVEEIICRSQTLTSIERLAVYGNAYYARLIECMAAEFPATQHAVGEDAFSGFVFGYLQEFPSTSYTLGDLGARFPEYLAESRPARDGDSPDWAGFLLELATLERVYSEVFDGPGEEQLSPMSAEMLQSIPRQSWPIIRLMTAPSLRLLELQFPAQEYAAAVRIGKEPVIPSSIPTWLAISRRDYIVRRRTLEPLSFRILSQLQSGHSLGTAIVKAVDGIDDVPADLTRSLQVWFHDWAAAGYFVGCGT